MSKWHIESRIKGGFMDACEVDIAVGPHGEEKCFEEILEEWEKLRRAAKNMIGLLKTSNYEGLLQEGFKKAPFYHFDIRLFIKRAKRKFAEGKMKQLGHANFWRGYACGVISIAILILAYIVSH